MSARHDTLATLCAAYVAEITGLPTWQLLALEPEGFGCPRDRVRFGGSDQYTVPGAWRLVTVLRTAGETAAAERLHAVLEQHHPKPTPCATNWWQQGVLA